MDVKFNEVFKRPLTRDELGQFHKTDLIELVAVYQARESILTQALHGALDLAERLADATVAISKRLLKTLDVFFGGSLKSPSRAWLRPKKAKKKPAKGKQRPSERYRHLELTEIEVKTEPPPQCGCGHEMIDSGMRESSERLEVKPKVYHIVRHQRVTYTCRHCHTGIATAPSLPQIIPGSCYGDSFVKDVVLSKLCDLIPISRYTAMAARQGVEGIPTNSLYDFSRHLAIVLGPSYRRLWEEIKLEPVLLADETRHRMLEGSKKRNWYLWCFNSTKGMLYRVEDTRASLVAADFLKDCACRVLVSDAYQGYFKAILDVNEMRREKSPSCDLILPAFCNAHARNNFCASSIKNTRQAKYMIWIYRIVFAHYPAYLELDGDALEAVRSRIVRAFQLMERIAANEMPKLSKNSVLYEAFEYFYKYYSSLTLFLTDRSIPMHNMQSENSLRNPVVGRKIWYGTHSPDAARDLVKIMSLVESCKFLKINPRAYIDDAVDRVHKGLPALSPYEYGRMKAANSS